MTAAGAVAAGYTLAAGPVRADAINTSAEGFNAPRCPKVAVPGGDMPLYVADRRGQEAADHPRRDGGIRPARVHQGRDPPAGQARPRSRLRRIITSGLANISKISELPKLCQSSTADQDKELYRRSRRDACLGREAGRRSSVASASSVSAVGVAPSGSIRRMIRISRPASPSPAA